MVVVWLAICVVRGTSGLVRMSISFARGTCREYAAREPAPPQRGQAVSGARYPGRVPLANEIGIRKPAEIPHTTQIARSPAGV